jgi:hypothetical protein
MADKPGTIGELKEDIKKQFDISGTDFANAFESMVSQGNKINKSFGQARARITEFQTAVVDATPRVNRLGGEVQQVTETINEIAEASRRNVVANTKDIEKLYASTKVLGGTTKDLVDSFGKIGVGISQIGPELEKSVKYIQSIGGNTKQVMDSVRTNIEQMNRYQFEGGVQGLTKMAAQASMLRFDMGQTFALAEKVLSPEGAIETAAAFQRLGVSAGALADPFQLMNQSINDPQGLQTSLSNVAKQFAEFDEKTKTFKINPQGVLTLKEMQNQTGVSAQEMSKMALAAAELDKRLTDVNKAGLKFGSEEDKQYLANIAKMGESGKYEVELKDGAKKDLANLNQDEFDELIKAQKDQPKTMEDIARAQMGVSEIIKGDVSAIRSSLLGGLVSAKPIQEGMEGVRRGLTGASGAASNQMANPKAVRNEVETGLKDIGQLFKDLQNKDIKRTDAISNYFAKLGKQGESIEGKFKDALLKTIDEARKNATDKTGFERLMKSGYDKALELSGGVKQNANAPISSLIEGNKNSQQIQNNVKSIASQVGTNNNKQTITHDGNITVNVNFTGDSGKNLNQSQMEQVNKAIVSTLRSTDYLQTAYNNANPGNPTKAPKNVTV